MKTNQRLDLERLAEALEERGLVEAAALSSILHHGVGHGTLFTEVLVQENLIADWELSRVACELFGLAFLPVDCYEPASEALENLDHDFLRRYCLVPLDRFGEVLTVAMPAMVTADVLAELSKQSGCRVLPLAGSVISNRAWLDEHLPRPEAALPSGSPDGDWANFFDQADQAVLMDLQTDVDEDADAGSSEEAA